MKEKKYIKIIIIIYYILLLFAILFQKDNTVALPLIYRLLFIFAVILPCLIIKNIYYPAIIALFYSLAKNGISYYYMLYEI